MGFPGQPRHGGHEHARATGRHATHLAQSQSGGRQSGRNEAATVLAAAAAGDRSLTRQPTPPFVNDTHASDTKATSSARADSFRLVSIIPTAAAETLRSQRNTLTIIPVPPPRRCQKQPNWCDGLSPFLTAFRPPAMGPTSGATPHGTSIAERSPAQAERAAQVQSEPAAKRSG